MEQALFFRPGFVLPAPLRMIRRFVAREVTTREVFVSVLERKA